MSDIVSIIDQVEDLDSIAVVLPADPAAFAAHFGATPRNFFVKLAIQLKLSRRPPEPMTPVQQKETMLFLRAFSAIKTLTVQSVNALRLKECLEVVMSRHPFCAPGSDSAWEFPPEHVTFATQLYNRFESEQWGLGDDILQEDEDEAEEPGAPGPPDVSTLTLAKQPSRTLGVLARSRPEHPIYGAHGIMRGIVVDKSGKLRSYKLDDQYPRRNSNAFGNNGLQNGEWWPLQICALRDGAHGMRVAGIAGSESKGACSIVVSGLYSDINNDQGNILYYCGSQSHANTDPTIPIMSSSTKALQRTLSLGHPVRVLRAASGESRLCPSVGIRYDGLYIITDQSISRNGKGGAYIRFRLQRTEGQAEIDRGRPTRDEKRDFELVKDAY